MPIPKGQENSDFFLKTRDLPGNSTGSLFCPGKCLPDFHVKSCTGEASVGHEAALLAGSTRNEITAERQGEDVSEDFNKLSFL